MRRKTFLFLMLMAACAAQARPDGRQVCSEAAPQTVQASASSAMKDSIRASFDYVRNGQPFDFTFLEVGARYCVACKQMAKVMDEVRAKHPRVNVRFIDVSEQGSAPWVQHFNIKMIPTQIILDREARVICRHVGFIPTEKLEKKFKK